MRSFDYSHFEITLGVQCDPGEVLTEGAPDELRKQAARLADKAVEQYKTAKAVEELRERTAYSAEFRREKVAQIRELAETDRTPEQMAILKEYDDAMHHASRRYDYQDDWED